MLWTYGPPLVCILAAIALLRKGKKTRNPRRLPLPPGPKGWPIIGNLFDIPKGNAWETYAEWGKVYGDIVYYQVMGQSIVILNSLRTCGDLLEKRSSIYSDRPQTVMLSELMSNDWNMSTQPYGTIWRQHRRAFHEHFRPNVTDKYRPVLLREVHNLLLRLLKTPGDFQDHIKLGFAAGILDIAYGSQIDSLHHPQIQRGETIMRHMTESAVPGTYLVDAFPLLKYIPSWMPGANFQRVAEETNVLMDELVKIPFDDMLSKMHSKEGGAESIASELYRNLPNPDDPHYQEELDIARDVCAIAYLGGSDTTVSVLQIFLMAMALHPEVVKKAHEEISNVVGPDRLPDFSDRDQLIYISAIVKETMRWQATTPIAVPHRATEDDEYDGYFIPKGSIVIGNAWSILHDDEAYDDPLSFNPDRFIKDGQLNPETRDPSTAAFGFGRRMCPGRHLAEDSLFATVASVLAVYDILPPSDDKPLACKMSNAIVSYPEEFSCRIIPRSEHVANMVASLALGLEGQEGDAARK